MQIIESWLGGTVWLQVMWMKKIACEIGVLVALSRMSLFCRTFFQGRNERAIRVYPFNFFWQIFFLSVFFSLNQSLESRETHTTCVAHDLMWEKWVMDKSWKMVEKMKWENELKMKRWRDEDWLTDFLQNEGSGERECFAIHKSQDWLRRGDFLRGILKSRMIFQVDRCVWLSVIVFFERVRWRCDYRLLEGRKKISRRRQSVGSRITMMV